MVEQHEINLAVVRAVTRKMRMALINVMGDFGSVSEYGMPYLVHEVAFTRVDAEEAGSFQEMADKLVDTALDDIVSGTVVVWRTTPVFSFDSHFDAFKIRARYHLLPVDKFMARLQSRLSDAAAQGLTVDPGADVKHMRYARSDGAAAGDLTEARRA